MDKVKLLAKVGVGLALVDFIFRGFGPLFTTSAQTALTAEHFIGTGMIPLIAIVSALALLKGKKWGLYVGIILVLISVVGNLGLLRGGEFTALPVLYLLVYGALVFVGFQQSKSLK